MYYKKHILKVRITVKKENDKIFKIKKIKPKHLYKSTI